MPATEALVRFGRELRGEGLGVGTGRIREFVRAAALLEPRDLYWAGRATLVAHPDQIPVYDRVFRAFFGGGGEAARARPAVHVEGELAGRIARASRAEVLRRKSFAELSEAELPELAALAARIAVPPRRTRRRRPAGSGSPDLRRTLRRSFRTGGEPRELLRRARRQQPRRLVLLLDVSRSMTDHSTALLVLAHAVVRRDQRWEAFCFGTRLTRVTRALAVSSWEDALERASAEVLDWDGGTRIGDSLKAFLDRHGHGGMARGAVVVICSDGLDVGDPALLGEQMARLRRLAHRVVWLNPLLASPAYEPLARGMHAALPHIDVFAGGHTLDSVMEALWR